MLKNFILHVHAYLYFTKFATSKRNRWEDIRAISGLLVYFFYQKLMLKF